MIPFDYITEWRAEAPWIDDAQVEQDLVISRALVEIFSHQVIEQEAHIAGLVAATRQDNPSSARDRLRLAIPAVATLLERLAARGESLRVHTARLLALLDDYGPQELGAAIARALERDTLGAGTIAHILETRRRQRGLKPPIPIALPDHPGVRDLDVTPHRLETYDDLTRSDPDDAE